MLPLLVSSVPGVWLGAHWQIAEGLFFQVLGVALLVAGVLLLLEGECAGGEEVVLTRLAPYWNAIRFVGWGNRNWRGDLFGSGIASVRCWKSA